MSDTAGQTFFSILVFVAVAIRWWRIALFVAGALLLSVIIYGIYQVMGMVEQQSPREVTVGMAQRVHVGSTSTGVG